MRSRRTGCHREAALGYVCEPGNAHSADEGRHSLLAIIAITTGRLVERRGQKAGAGEIGRLCEYLDAPVR